MLKDLVEWELLLQEGPVEWEQREGPVEWEQLLQESGSSYFRRVGTSERNNRVMVISVLLSQPICLTVITFLISVCKMKKGKQDVFKRDSQFKECELDRSLSYSEVIAELDRSLLYSEVITELDRSLSYSEVIAELDRLSRTQKLLQNLTDLSRTQKLLQPFHDFQSSDSKLNCS